MKLVTVVAYCISTSMKIYTSKCIPKTSSPLSCIFLYTFVYMCIYIYFSFI